MQHEAERDGFRNGAAAEAVSGAAQVAPRLDPAEVQRSILELSARIRQLEEEARQVSAPFLMESVLRETADMRLQSVKAAERTYQEAIEAAEQEAHRILDEAEAKADVLLDQARAEGQRQAAEIMEQARREAGRIRNSALEQRSETRQELERVSAEFNSFVKRLLDRTAGEHAESEAAIRLEPAPPIAFAPAPVHAPAAAPRPAVESAETASYEAAEAPVAELDRSPEPVAAFDLEPEQSEQEALDDGSTDLAYDYETGPACWSAPSATSALNADWGHDWADQLRELVPLAEPDAEQPATEPIAEEKPVESMPAPPAPPAPVRDGAFKLPSWLPS